MGLDCPYAPWEDNYASLVLYARTEKELSDRIEAVWKGSALEDEPGAVWYGWDDGDLATTLPELICDMRGKIAIDLMKMVHGSGYNPKSHSFSHGEENIIQFWEREKWRFVN